MLDPGHPSDLADESFYTFGARTILDLLTKLENQIDGAQEGQDIEYVHRLRVASRRLRVAMPMFRGCFTRKHFKLWTKEIKHITRSFGVARDLDVQIVFLKTCQEAFRNKPAEAGIEFLLANHRKRRTDIQPDVVRSLKDLRNSRILADMRKACRNILNRREVRDTFESEVTVEASYQISERLYDLLSKEECVPKEDLIAEHHEMRILAKRLRYTMEIFSPQYAGRLEGEISTMKRFQDALGDMHDYDVWIEYLPRFVEEVQTNHPEASEEVVLGLGFLVEHVKNLRRIRYQNFVSLWEETQSRGIFQNLMHKIQEGLASKNHRLRNLMETPNPKIGLMADIHGNLRALEAVLSDAEDKGVDVFLNAGDSVGYGVFPNEVVGTLRDQGVLSIKGNFDIKAVKKKGRKKDVDLGLVIKRLSKSATTYLDLLPDRIILEVKGKRILLTHGSPVSVKESILPNTPRTRLRRLARSAHADIVVLGHTHMPFEKTIDGVKFVNPGSIGRPYDGDPRASYAILGMEPVSIELVKVDYDRASAAHEMRRADLPEDFAQMLLRGVPHDVIEAEVRLGHQSKTEMKDRLRIVREVAGEYGEVDGHAEQVRRLALKLFDCFKDYHGLGARERYLLECAALLHDIGWSEGQKGHNKTSLKIILDNQKLPFTSVERSIVGSLARYHRKGFPKRKHTSFSTLSSEDRNVILTLSSLLRIADGLDYSHVNRVKKLSIVTEPDQFIIRCVPKGDPTLEEEQFNKKKDFFEKTFSSGLLIEWMPS